MRLIDVDNLVSVLEILCDKTGDIRYWEQLKWIVGDMPTIDAVEVVRCKNCKHRHDDGYCEVWGDSFHYWEDFNKVPEDMFCGYGERREKCGK